MLNCKLHKFRLILTGLILTGLLGGGLVGQAQQGQVIGSEHAILIVAKAVTKFDIMVLANSCVASATILNETFTIALEGGATRTVAKQEIATLDLKGNGRLQDRIILKAGNRCYGEVLQGDLQSDAFQLRLASGEEITLPKTQVRGAIMQFLIEGLPPAPGEAGPMVEVFKCLLDSPLTPEAVNSLTKYDWIWLNNEGLLSGVVIDEQFIFQEEGPFPKDELSVIIFGGAGLVIAVDKQGKYIIGDLEASEINFKPCYQDSIMTLATDQIHTIIFRVPSLGTGG